MGIDAVALTNAYFGIWNSHDVAGIQARHAPTSLLKDWDGEHGPTNELVAKGIAGSAPVANERTCSRTHRDSRS